MSITCEIQHSDMNSHSCSSEALYKIIVATSQKAIVDLLNKLGVHFPEYSRDLELEAHVKAVVRQWEQGNIMEPLAASALVLTTTAYSHIASLETKLQITLFTILIGALDDPSVFESLPSRDFHRLMCGGTVRKEESVLGAFAELLSDMWAHYPLFTANTIFTSALRFINASIAENDFAQASLGSCTLPFVEYKRSMSATTEAYACFIWDKTSFPDVNAYIEAIPDIMLYVSYVNDILSFYKEELAGETRNYIHERASATGKTTEETLADVVCDVADAVKRIHDILGKGPARDAWENFAAGYITVHTRSPRYRLQEVIGEKYLLDINTCC
ncbi:terpenoid synthase [Laetiporus sulphureus 93-53]|uniref:Terpenoid synthase n=1 Tax=Laetiporus sulphureus 93-53 TaxID=1314785 RepID=A0A165F737_9APHY|nr:terpenoid synthase [Laetiporus sulphureus 93-53]KZT08515.1 terpenoid synthase [Laetiporus sulphureus 93-53]